MRFRFRVHLSNFCRQAAGSVEGWRARPIWSGRMKAFLRRSMAATMWG